MERTVHDGSTGYSQLDGGVWFYFTRCRKWVELVQTARVPRAITCGLCKAYYSRQERDLPIMWADDLPDSQASLWVDPP